MKMHKLCEFIDDELKELEKKAVTKGSLTAAELEYGDKLAHFKKSLLTNEAMEEADGGHSERGSSYGYDMSYRNDRSYARGRTGNVRRDSMGRYSREDAMEDMEKSVRESMPHMSEAMRREAERFLSKLDTM